MTKVVQFLVLSVWLLSACKKEKEEKVFPLVTDLTESVYSSVTVQPDSLYEVFGAVNGIIDKYFVTEGQKVTIGQALLQIHNTTPQLNAENARAAMEQARNNASPKSEMLMSVAAEINNAQMQLKNDSMNWERQKSLWSQNIGSRVDYETRKLKYETSRNVLAMLRDKYTNTQSTLLTTYKQANLQYQALLSNSGDFILKSLINGTVYTINSKAGELVLPQLPLASVGSSNSYIIEMLIDEVDITRVKIDQTIFLTLDAYGKKTLKAKVTKIYPAKDLKNQTFRVEGRFVEPPDVLYPGLNGEANIVIKTRKNVLSIPNEYLSSNNEVHTKKGMVKVKTGLSSMERTEILEGIDKNTQILKLK